MTFRSILVISFILLVISSDLPAQSPPVVQQAVNATAVNAGPANALTVSPKPQPKRALKYRLMPSVYEQKPGNAAVMYLMAASNLPKEAWPEKYKKWLELPLDELPAEQVDAAIGNASDLGMLRGAARRMRVEWDNTNIRVNGFAALLPHVHHHRTLARRMALRIRLRIKQKRYDEAIEDIKTVMAMGHHLESGGTLIESLVGMACCHIMTEQLEELIQQPDAPNLYWALAELPHPLIDMRQAMQYEQFWIQFMYKQTLVRQAQEPFTLLPHNANQDFIFLLGTVTDNPLFMENRDEEGMKRVRMMAAGFAIYQYPRAKRYFMKEKGMTEAEVDKLPVSHVAMVYELDRFTYWRDELFKWMAVPHWQAVDGLRETEARFTKAVKQRDTGMLAAILLPAISATQRASVRLDRRLAALQTIEALRMHAAEHGRWPDSLADLKAPAPRDPYTGKPFIYNVAKDGTATVQGPVADANQTRDAIHYRVTLRK